MSEFTTTTDGYSKTGHVGSTKAYYDKWNSLVDQELEKVQQQECEEEQQSKTQTGGHLPSSKAEEDDLARNEELAEAKKLWDERKRKEAGLTLTVENEENITSREINADTVGQHRVVKFKNCKNCVYTLPSSLSSMIKLFIEDCTDVTLNISCPFITSNIEAVHCEKCVLNISSKILTVQADLCQSLELCFTGAGEMSPVSSNLSSMPSKVYWAGCPDLVVKSSGLVYKAPSDYQALADETGGLFGSSCYEEVQFVVHIIDGALQHERILRTVDNLPSTAREMGLQCDGTEESEKARLAALEQTTLTAKSKGGEHFKAGEYAQAAVEYTRALEHGRLHDYDGMHLLFSNRAFCFSKLGQHEKALADAEEAIKAEPSFTKGWFRKGIALHALGRFQEACPILGKALELEPKNRQIKDALRFAEMRVAQQGRV